MDARRAEDGGCPDAAREHYLSAVHWANEIEARKRLRALGAIIGLRVPE